MLRKLKEDEAEDKPERKRSEASVLLTIPGQVANYGSYARPFVLSKFVTVPLLGCPGVSNDLCRLHGPSIYYKLTAKMS